MEDEESFFIILILNINNYILFNNISFYNYLFFE